MKDRKGIRKLLLALCLTTVFSVTVVGKIRCKYNEFKVEDVVGNLSCVPCKKCPVGEGLSPQCGTFIPYGTRIECKACRSGVSYSSTYSIESCQPCGICVDHDKVLQKCNKTQNSICAKNCDVGFYSRSAVGDCQECSWCCPDSSPSDQEADCKKDGVPFYKHCSVDVSIRCKPRCTDKQYIIVTEDLNRVCHDCPRCGVGKGLYPKCQSVLSSIKKSKCQGCVPGKTFSDATDSSSCKPCKVCGVGKKTQRSCNVTHNAVCGDCDHGFYNESIRDNKEVNCKPCSYCCGDDKDVIIPECVAQGMPPQQQCAYTNRALTKCGPTSEKKKDMTFFWIGLSFVSFIMIVGIIVGVLYWHKKCRSMYGKLENQTDSPSLQEVVVLGKEFPSEESTPNNIEFRHSGIIVHCQDIGAGEALLRNMTVEICWDKHKDLPYRREIYLSPLIQFHPPRYKLETPITLDIPHSAYQQEENNSWKIKVLKVGLPTKDGATLELTELGYETNIEVKPCSVSFTVKELGAYVVVGEAGEPKCAKKRMQCAVFGAVPRIGQTYSTVIYIFDDGESTLKKLQRDEKNEGRRLLKAVFRTLHPDVHEKSVIGVAIENVKEGWKEELSSEVIKCCEWINSYQGIPNVKASFKHINPKIRDFHCTFKLKFKEQVVEIPVFHFSEPESISKGIQPSDQDAPSEVIPIGVTEEGQTPVNSLQSLSAVPTEVLTGFCKSLDQAIGKDHSRIESVAVKIIPSISRDEVGLVRSSDCPFTSLIDLANSKEIDLTAATVKNALEAEGLNSAVLMPYLYKGTSSPQV